MTFNTIMWLSAPVKVLSTKNIHEIHVPILDLGNYDGEVIMADTVQFDSLDQLDKCVIRADEEDILRFETFG